MNLNIMKQGIKKAHTPCYIFDLEQARHTGMRHRSLMTDRMRLCYAMKANPFLTETMAKVADCIEVCSMGEFRICKALGIDPGKLLISGVLKKHEDLAEILELYGGDCRYTAESISQFQQLERWAKEHDTLLTVFPRLSSGNQFGMDLCTIKELLNRRKEYPNIQIKGIHYFSGTQKRSVEKICKELQFLDQVYEEIKESCQMELSELEYGPGLNVPYFEGQEDTLESDYEAIGNAVEAMKWKGIITFEMGRALAADCGVYATSICDLKQTEDKQYCIVDGGIHQMNYDGQLRGMYHPKLSIHFRDGSLKEAEENERNWTICGSLCTTNDVLLQKYPLKNPTCGDILCFHKTGAYSMTEGMALFLSHELPTIMTYENGTIDIVRQELQTFELNYKRR